jgi:L-Ala-D/L-Glu epimerase
MNLELEIAIEQFPYKAPFRISGHVFTMLDALVVRLRRNGFEGRGEATGIYYRSETADGMAAQIEMLRPTIEAGLDRAALQAALPPGGARNALDCAMWELESRERGLPVWQMTGVPAPKPLVTTYTIGADSPAKMAGTARHAFAAARAIKLKLIGDGDDAARVEAVRAARPDVWLGVDANQGWTQAQLRQLLPVMIDNKVALIEQPFPVGDEAFLDDIISPIPIAADESAQVAADIPNLIGRFSLVNIKLDKSGGLTEALAMADAARRGGLGIMVGNMVGTSLAMAPSFIIGQLCDVVDLDGPLSLAADRTPSVAYQDGRIWCESGLWGAPDQISQYGS